MSARRTPRRPTSPRAEPPGPVADGRTRCGWVKLTNPLYVHYHDTEWGVPERDDRALFEKLLLDGAQAGLAWETILNKRENYRRAFHGFDPERIARYGERDRARLLADAGIVRNRQKVDAFIGNARAYLAFQDSHREGFARWMWGFVDGHPQVNRWRTMRELPARTETSDRLSKELQGMGFKFVGSTIVYAFMQAVGMVNDHLVDCFRHGAVGRRRGKAG